MGRQVKRGGVYERDVDETVEESRNEDPITGAAGAHPVGAGVGAAAGGAAGAAVGAVGGPLGAIVGAVVGGVAGGLAGKAVAEDIDPTVELEYWRSAYANRPYYSEQHAFGDYESAYRAGMSAYDPSDPVAWEERELIARESWESEGGAPRLSWDEARAAAADAYGRVHATRCGKPR